MKFTALIVALPACLLAGCQPILTLEQARAQCTKQGGFLVVIHSQKITMAGPGEEIDSPGNCVLPDKFDVPEPPNAPKPSTVSGSPPPSP